MLGLVQQRPLLISGLLDYAERFHGGTEIVSRTLAGAVHRSNYGAVAARARHLARALQRLGVDQAGRVATLAWNDFRHLELHFAIPGSGRILHTVNPRLFPEQIAYIINHAQNGMVFFDVSFSSLVEQLAPQLPGVRCFVALAERTAMPNIRVPDLLCYEDLLPAESDDFGWPSFDENTASTLCYTSGTTGDPKGVLHSHRSVVLHALATTSMDAVQISARDSILVLAPMFHVNAWGIPFAAAMTGAKLVLPGPNLDGESIWSLLRDEGCNAAAGVPTVWLNFLAYVEQNRDRLDLSQIALTRVMSGGSAVPRVVMETLDQWFGAVVIQAWGMTESGPMATATSPLLKHRGATREQRIDLQMYQGRALWGAEVKIVDAEGRDLPNDGVATGELMLRGPWVIASYYEGNPNLLDAHGWFATGDVASIDADGFVRLTDRLKDVIKSGGEWISSIAVENVAVSHPAVREAAVIAVEHPIWQERPLLLVTCKPEVTLTRQEMLQFLATRMAKWWLPDDVLFVDELPHTATGKLLKTKLREVYRNHLTVNPPGLAKIAD